MKCFYGNKKYQMALLCVVLGAGFLTAQELLKQHVDNPGQTAMDQVPSGHVPGVLPQSMAPVEPGPIGQAVVTGNGINYHGGPGLKGNPVKFYVIWYGNWSGTGSNTAATASLVNRFINTLRTPPTVKTSPTY